MPLPAEYLKNGGPGRTPGVAKPATTAARERMLELGFDPIQCAVEWIRSTDKSEDTKNFCLNLLMKRYSPEIKQVEHSGSIEGIDNRTINVIYSPDKPKEIE